MLGRRTLIHFRSFPFSRLVIVTAGVYMIFYVIWRLAATINPEAVMISYLLWAGEAFGVINFLLFFWMTWRVDPIVPYRPPRPGLKVDVFIPTYNEEEEILEATLAGCRRLTYPHRTYLLDDGRRESVRRLAERMGAGYITRPDNRHAKAGNLNHALTKTDGEFIVILDADMVPQPNLIERTLGYFEDPQLAFVQLPQEFYNRDSLQHDPSRPDWHEQSLFFHVIQPGKNYTNSAFWCGSPSVVRRKALEDVGGVATETITEDIHTSVRLHSRGWKSLFVNESLAFGIAPQTVTAYLLQRLRWAQGTMQLYRGKESPLWIPGLNLAQRLSYLASFMAYLESIQKFIFLLLPVMIILLNVLPMRVELSLFLLLWTPYFVLNIAANQIGGRGYFHYFKSEVYSFLRMTVFLQSLMVLVVNKPLKFKVTPKSVDRSVYEKERQALRWHFGLLGALIGALLFGSLRNLLSGQIPLGTTVFLIVLFWAFYNLWVIAAGIREVLRRRHERRHYRFTVDLEGVLHWNNQTFPVHIFNLSPGGAGVRIRGVGVSNGEMEGGRLVLELPNRSHLLIPLEKIKLREWQEENGCVVGGVVFQSLEDETRMALFEYLFVDLPAQESRFKQNLSGFWVQQKCEQLAGKFSAD
ncbi:MAG: hypothetical protein KatS3mg045_1418 [Bellilinea sp.]|nr:MAG: hypothetical protein KatS3mg045_1418 [Bellilinea sp.]